MYIQNLYDNGESHVTICVQLGTQFMEATSFDLHLNFVCSAHGSVEYTPIWSCNSIRWTTAKYLPQSEKVNNELQAEFFPPTNGCLGCNIAWDVLSINDLIYII